MTARTLRVCGALCVTAGAITIAAVAVTWAGVYFGLGALKDAEVA